MDYSPNLAAPGVEHLNDRDEETAVSASRHQRAGELGAVECGAGQVGAGEARAG
jgi:hypothetical protein